LGSRIPMHRILRSGRTASGGDLREMWDKADRAIDEQTGRSAPTK
jgi:hypothetical protein